MARKGKARKGQAIKSQAKHSDREDLIMAIPSQIDASPFFTVLPPELRLQIYEAMFEGSKAGYKQEYTVGSHTQHHVLLPTYHYKFLLTCRQAYNEALKTYWSKTILYGDYADRELVFFLRSVVPDFAKLHVRHIRGLNDYAIRRCPIRECLQDFKKLQTIGFNSRWFLNVTPYIRNHELPPEMLEQVEEHLKSHPPGDGEFSQLIYDGGPVVLGRVFFGRGEIEGSYLTEGRYEKDRTVCFINYSTGKMFDAGYPSDPENDEWCFLKVLENPGDPGAEGDESSQGAFPKDIVIVERHLVTL